MALLAKEQRWRYCCLTAFLILLGLWALTSPVALAQEASATVNGVVSDPTGAAIPNAQVNLTNVNTTVVRSTKANTDGAYAFLNVLPGVYMLQASAAGFASVTQSAVTLEVNQTATFDFHLKVGETQTSVTVEATAAAVESSTSELGTVVANQEVVDLPLNGRNFTQLLTITPGVVNIHTDQSAGGGGLFVGNALGEYVQVVAVAFGISALGAGRFRTWFARSPRRLELVGGAGGLAIVAVGAGVIVSGRKD